MTRDEYADHLAEAAQELVVRVRDDDPEANGRWLATLSERERRDLLIVLAAAVPDDRPWLHLTAWTAHPRRAAPRPCGTRAAAKRHRTRGEQPCTPCVTAEREYWRVAKATRRHTTSPSTTEVLTP